MKRGYAALIGKGSIIAPHTIIDLDEPLDIPEFSSG
jgi:hypothetical protein